jgi:hypothetical protein
MKKSSPYNPSQIEFCDNTRIRKRPSGSGSKHRGHFVFVQNSQTLAHVAYTLECTPQHVKNQMDAGEFPNAIDVSSDTSRKPEYRIPRDDVIAYIESRIVR